MKKLNMFLMVAAVIIAPTMVLADTNVATSTTAKDYSACDGLNDYLSYSRCVSDVDNKRAAATTLAIEEPKAIDGDYSIKINNGEAKTNKTTVTLSITAAKEAVNMVVNKDNNFGFSGKQAIKPTVSWQIDDEENAPQYVYVKFYDAAGLSLKVVMASIILDKRQGDPAAETEAKKVFKLMYGRAATASAVDAEAVKIMAYGLLPNTPRDLVKETTALTRFRQVFKHAPLADQEWNAVKGYAYATTAVTAAKTAVSAPATASADKVVAEEPVKDCRLKTKLTANLDVGSKGKEVIALQESLKCQGMLAADYKVTGKFDSDTELAVGAFQKQNKLLCKDKTYCGGVGPATRDKFNKLPAPKATTATSVPAKTVVVKAVLTRDLTVDMTGDDVTKLQEFLAKDKSLYPEGLVTGKFGPATENAVKKFQAKNNLKCADGTACGYIGPSTRKKLNQAMSE